MGLGRPEAPPLEQFLAIGLEKRTAQNAIVNQKVTSNLLAVIKEAGVEMCDKSIGNLLYTVATKYPANALVHRPVLVQYVVSTQIKSSAQLDAAFSFLTGVGPEPLQLDKFEQACGIGVEVSLEEIQASVKEIVDENMDAILEQRYHINVGSLCGQVRKLQPWADAKIVEEEIDQKLFEVLGEKTEADEKKPMKKKKEKPAKPEVQATVATPPPSDMDNQALAAFEGILGYRFTKKSLLEAALTHDSYCSTLNGKVSFEQLVLMGDRVVNFFFKALTNKLDLGPKQLTLLQCPDINDEYLACICVTHRLHPYIRHKLPILERRISELIQDMEIVDLRFCGLLNPPKVLWDVVKSVLGAIYIDSDFCYNTVWKIFSRLTHPLDYLETFVVHPIEELEQLCESLDYELDFDENWEEDRTIRVLVNGESIGGVTYRSNEEICKNRAAKLALDMLN